MKIIHLRLSTDEHVADDFRQRRGDAGWRLRAAAAPGGWLHVLVMLEFQSRNDPSMALRVLEYSAFQPSQRHVVLDERHAPADDPRLRDLTRAVLLLSRAARRRIWRTWPACCRVGWARVAAARPS